MKKRIFFVAILAAVGALAFFSRSQIQAQDDSQTRILNVYVDGSERTIATQADTVGEALKSSGVKLYEHDKSEPSSDTEISSNNFNINVYRARPITVIDGPNSYTITTAERTPRAVATSAGFKPRAEDGFEYAISASSFDGATGTVLHIKRSKEITFELYGKSSKLRTQALTVQDLLDEKDVELEKGDEVSPALSTRIKSGMKVSIATIDKKTETVEEVIKFPEELIRDANQPTSYRLVKTPGVNGRKLVTYEIIIRNGKEFKKKTLKTVITKQPVKQVAVVGAKSVTFSGDFAEALARLRSCEGGYTSWNPNGPYYGAYQFDERTWGEVADPSKYGNATPSEQDAAAHALYLANGWGRWPVCGAPLPDIYR
jgi:uncharacterized protein YabE (DUF348 family)